jgi:hypothetical protein
MRVRPWCVETSWSCSLKRTSCATRMSGASSRSSSGHCHGRNATGRELPIGQRQILAFSHSGDGVGLLEFADNLHSSHNVCRLQEAVQSERLGAGSPARRVGCSRPQYLVASSDSPSSYEAYGVAS